MFSSIVTAYVQVLRTTYAGAKRAYQGYSPQMMSYFDGGSIFVTLCAKGDRRYRDVTKFFKNFQPHYNDLSPVNCKYVWNLTSKLDFIEKMQSKLSATCPFRFTYGK